VYEIQLWLAATPLVQIRKYTFHTQGGPKRSKPLP